MVAEGRFQCCSVDASSSCLLCTTGCEPRLPLRTLYLVTAGLQQGKFQVQSPIVALHVWNDGHCARLPLEGSSADWTIDTQTYDSFNVCDWCWPPFGVVLPVLSRLSNSTRRWMDGIEAVCSFFSHPEGFLCACLPICPFTHLLGCIEGTEHTCACVLCALLNY